MFRLIACARAESASRFAAKDCRAVFIEQRFLTPGHQEHSLWWPFRFRRTNYVGEFMRTFIALAAVAAALCGQPAFAEDTAKSEAVRIETDQQAKAFVFIIDDEPVAILDKNGFQVVEHLSYGRSLTDKGPDGVRREIAERLKEAADE